MTAASEILFPLVMTLGDLAFYILLTACFFVMVILCFILIRSAIDSILKAVNQKMNVRDSFGDVDRIMRP